jgi:hypothetical protein
VTRKPKKLEDAPNPPEPKKLSMKERHVAATNQIGQHVYEMGWTSDDVLRDWAVAQGYSLTEAHAAISKLDRSKVITQKRDQQNVLGWEFLKSSAPPRVEYRDWKTIRLRMRFLTAPLGQISLDNLNFDFERDEENRPVFTAGQFRAMLFKSYNQSPLVEDAGIFRSALDRWSVRCTAVQGTEVIERIRRPINTEGKAVGELRHKALKPGATIEWEATIPTSIWTPDRLAHLLKAAESVGFSPAGNGSAGGLRGLFTWDKLES